jgi:hypothetical protein
MKEKFKKIFEGLKIAYGQYQKGDRDENGKQKGKAFIVRGNVTDDLWEKHLNGEGPALGIIPITENNTCRWGCIDIDEYNFDHRGLIHNIRSLNLPLLYVVLNQEERTYFYLQKILFLHRKCKVH